ncbi:MAG TPA: YggS family pyridoxal phosphate-dependent enzyme [Chthonomonadales bacterium]|nr:YggS family pyridoxal phosphate-dependent enzyme [Chthonomonadales bacterium]
MSSIAANIAHVRERISLACHRAGRSPEAVTLVGVTKGVDSDRIAEARRAGLVDFGENYYQEVRGKMDHMPAPVRWHFIGRLQSNKAKYVVGRFALVHSVDSAPLATELSRRAVASGVEQPVLVEVKLDTAHSRAGAAPDKALDLAEMVAQIPGLRLDGLMGITALDASPDQARETFALLRQLFAQLPPENRRCLSMGMTQDYEIAIEEGATMVRIGTAIFGPRPVEGAVAVPAG